MSTPTLVGAASGGLLLVAGGFVLVRRFAKR
jgi:LPXTG-motif cell wall-anchored protein